MDEIEQGTCQYCHCASPYGLVCPRCAPSILERQKIASYASKLEEIVNKTHDKTTKKRASKNYYSKLSKSIPWFVSMFPGITPVAFVKKYYKKTSHVIEAARKFEEVAKSMKIIKVGNGKFAQYYPAPEVNEVYKAVGINFKVKVLSKFYFEDVLYVAVVHADLKDKEMISNRPVVYKAIEFIKCYDVNLFKVRI